MTFHNGRGRRARAPSTDRLNALTPVDRTAATSHRPANAAKRNGDLGISALLGVIDGGGNHAFGNGNPAQCVNIAC